MADSLHPPHIPWVILVGSVNPKLKRMHTEDEVRLALQTWRMARGRYWKKVSWVVQVSAGSVSFHGKPFLGQPPREGFMLYGTSPFDVTRTDKELRYLIALLTQEFGQEFAELHLKSRVIVGTSSLLGYYREPREIPRIKQ